MAKKKSSAQIRRLQLRAQARGEDYVPPPPPSPTEEGEASASKPKKDSVDERIEITENLQRKLQEIDESTDLKSKDRRSAKRKAEAVASEASGMPVEELLKWYEKNAKKNAKKSKKKDPETLKKESAAKKLKASLDEIEKDEEMKSKDRRSAKRKAEAIATEESGLPPEELLAWYATYEKSQTGNTERGSQRRHDPYIAFVGQLSYETTKEELLQHIQEQLKDERKVKAKDVKIRILTDAKTKRSRGMAFLEVEDPELLYALLKMHQTFLNGRRINVERSAGGKKNSETRKAKLTQYRKEQEGYFGEIVDAILQEYKGTGELREDELDSGVVALCKRHAGPVVRAAVAEYMEKGGRDMDNPSAYLSFLLTKFSTEGIREEKENAANAKRSNPKRGGGDSQQRKRPKSEFSKQGVDMSMSEKLAGEAGNLAKVFPSARRGRGRGYM